MIINLCLFWLLCLAPVLGGVKINARAFCYCCGMREYPPTKCKCSALRDFHGSN